jgi:hypothetical protein
MIRLKTALNYKGGLLLPGTVIGLGDLEEKLITNGAAEKYELSNEGTKPNPETNLSEEKVTRNEVADENEPSIEKSEHEPVLDVLQTKTKAELLAYINQANIAEITAKNKKEEILKALIDAVNNGFNLKLDTGDAD